ncbi:MAG: 5-formyltetrahydrofolate cyclo-ligase [Treponema sp. CETP13]|nr:MAG: 5-formyltetrahydrofolate cyclo-ligase [Treponema sp. CETP13]
MSRETNRKTKDLLRKEMREMTFSFSQNKDDVLTASIKTANLVTMDERYKKADTILIFMSLPNEIQTELIIENAILDGKKVAIPKVINKTQILFYYLDPKIPILNQVSKGKFSVSEPLESAKLFHLQKDEQILVFVPGLAFTTTGDRLGHGKGYYDRYLNSLLENFSSSKHEKIPYICGLCYDFQIRPFIPMEITDVPVDCIFTNANIYNS